MPTTWGTTMVDNYGTGTPYYGRYAHAVMSLPPAQTIAPAQNQLSGWGTGPRTLQQTSDWNMYAKRLFEEFGLRDVWDEFAHLDDDGMSATGILKNLFGIGDNRPSRLGSALWQTVNALPQATHGMAVESNRLLGAAQLALPNAGWAEGPPVVSTGNPWRNYLTGGLTPQEQEDGYTRSAPGVYKPLTSTDLLVVHYDRMIKEGAPNWLGLPTNVAATWQTLGLVHGDQGGPMANGSYLPRAFDLTTADAGEQMEQAGIYQSQRQTANLANDLMFDPLNYVAAPIGGLLQARKGYTLIRDTQRALDALGPNAERASLIGTGSDYTGWQELHRIERRVNHRPAGFGLMNQGRMLRALQGGRYDPMLDYIVNTTDPVELARFFGPRRRVNGGWQGTGMVATSDEAYRMGLIASRLTSRNEVVHLFNAAGYRNIESVQVLDNVLADTETLRNEFRSALNLNDDLFEQAALDFAGVNGRVPVGHILADNADQFIGEVLDSNRAARDAWDALGAPEQDVLRGRVAAQQGAMHAMQRIFGEQEPMTATGRAVAKTVDDLVPIQGAGTLRFLPRPGVIAGGRREGALVREMTGDPGWWASHSPVSFHVDGSKLARYRPSIIFMDKPGLHFSLHGEDAVDKVNDIIRWTDALIAPSHLDQVPTRGIGDARTAVRFTLEHDPELAAWHREFMDAGVTASRPEQARAPMMDRFQELVLRRMAEATGFEPEVASMIAARGMDKGREMVDGLARSESGYITVWLDNGRSVIYKSQPTVERQAANYVPLMDLRAAYRAMYAVRRGENALTGSETDLVSTAKAREYFGAEGQYGKRQLKYVGRERNRAAYAQHVVTDLADAVNQIFKPAVLLRLGYTARNLTEGLASVMAGGMSALELARFADFGGLLHNAMWNAKNFAPRQIDRLLTFTGLRANDNALALRAEAAAHLDVLHQDQLHRFSAMLANPQARQQWADIANDTTGAYTAEEQARAAESLRFFIDLEHRLALGVTAENIAGMGGFRAHSSAGAAQHLYHVDSTGVLRTAPHHDTEGVYGLDQDLDRPIRTVDDPARAALVGDAAWTPIPVGGLTEADQLVQFQAAARAAGGGTRYRYVTRGGRTRETDDPAVALRNHNPAHPVTVHRVRAARTTPGGTTVGLAPDWGPITNRIAIDLNDALLRNGLELDQVVPELDALFADTGGIRAGVGEAELRAARADLDRAATWYERLAARPNAPREHQQTADALRVQVEAFDNEILDRTIATPGRITPEHVYPGSPVTMPGPTLHAALRRAGIRGRTHHIQMRDNANTLWRPYDRRQVTASTQVRAVGRDTHPNGAPRTISVDTWGSELDLRNTQNVRDALARYRDMDEPTLRAAMSGDHAAQDHLSEVLSQYGIYRVVLPERNRNWGRYQILVHPKGVGERGLRDVVEQDFNAEVGWRARRAAQAARPQRLGIRETRRLNRRYQNRLTWTSEEKHHLLGQPLTNDNPFLAADILQNGDARGIADGLVEAAIRARRDRYVTAAAYQGRIAKQARLAKRRGIRDTANAIRIASRFQTPYGDNQYIANSLLSGPDGAVFGALASGRSTYALGYAEMGYLTELMNDLRRSQFLPQTISPDDPRYFDALANMFARQYRDQLGFEAGGVDNLDPVVRQLLAPGDRQRLVSDTIDWALNTEPGRQWVRTLGLRTMPERAVPAETVEAERLATARTSAAAAPTTRAQAREPVEIEIPRTTVGDMVSTMSNFLEHWVLASPEATQLLLDGNVTGDLLRAAHDANPWPLHPVHGLLSPTTAESRQMLMEQRHGMQSMERLNHSIVRGMSKALEALGPIPETRMLRHPLFEMVGQADLRQRVQFAEASAGRALSMEEFNGLIKRSQRFALKKVEQTLYTLHGRNAVDDYMRFVAPFFPAWRNAITRWGRFMAESPGNVALLANRVQSVGKSLTLVNENGEDVDFNEAGANNTYVILPGIGGLLEKLKGVKGAQSAMQETRIPLRSMDVIFQGDMLSPGFGPWAAAPLQWLLTGHPEWVNGPVTKWVSDKVFPVGPTDTGQPVLDYASLFLPTAVRNMVQWAIKPESYANEFARNQTTLQYLQQKGELPPTDFTTLQQDAQRLTWWKMLVKVVSSLASPVAERQTGDIEHYAAVYRQLRDAYGNIEMADDAFNKLYPAEYLLTISSSKNLTGGGATESAEINQKRYRALQALAVKTDSQDLLGFVENYDDKAFSVGQASEGFSQETYSPFARRWQRLHGPKGSPDEFRRALTPEETQRKVLVKQTYQKYDEIRAIIGRNLVQQGLAPGSWDYQQQMDQQMAYHTSLLGQQVPEWKDEYGKRDEDKLLRTETFFKQVLHDPALGFITPERQNQSLVRSINRYFELRDAIRNGLLQRYIADPQHAGMGTDATSNYDLALLLAQQREILSNESPAFRQWADRYFRHDYVSINKADLLGKVS